MPRHQTKKIRTPRKMKRSSRIKKTVQVYVEDYKLLQERVRMHHHLPDVVHDALVEAGWAKKSS